LELLQSETCIQKALVPAGGWSKKYVFSVGKFGIFFSYLVQVYHLVWCRETVAACLLCLCSTLLWWSRKRMQCLWKARILRGLSFASHGTLSKRWHSKKHKQEQNWRSFTILLASVFLVRMTVNLPHELWRLSILCPVCRWTCHTSYEDYQFCVLCVGELATQVMKIINSLSCV
jgi:hypothetical protein